MGPLALLLGLLGALEGIERLTVEVLNPSTFGGHRIFHLEDVLGKRRRLDIPNLPAPRVVLIFTVEAEGCRDLASGWCGAVDEMLKAPWAKEGLALAVVLANRDAEEELSRLIPYAGFRFPVSVDAHGLLRQTLKVVRPGEFLVVQSNGENSRISPPSNLASEAARGRHLKEVEKAFEEAIRRDKEAEE
ncbi:MAG: hypothetical protein IPG45_10065 [Deltaproteobacteria bacterium]|nr:hypothetical protein [Deltaproteobacteria bacterium]